MSSYNNFFEKPLNLSQTRVENLFEHIYSSLGHGLAIYNELLLSEVSDFLKANYRLYLSNKVYQDRTEAQQTVWIAKEGCAPVVIEISNLKFGYGVQREIFGDIDKPADEHCTLAAVAANPEDLEFLYTSLAPYSIVGKNKIYLLVNSYGEVDLKPLSLSEADINLGLNYGEDFLRVNDKIVESLNTKTSGLYLFYGEPGTGKSSYIKYLLSGVLERRVVYVPINLINSLMSPDMLPLLMNNKNIILVIEDAEKALLSREENHENSSVVSAILNLTDSFISSALNISIVATFNTAKENIDKALLRKGRLKYCHEFKKLSVYDAQVLTNSLNFQYKVSEPMTLAEVYNIYESSGYSAPKEKIISGFGCV
jgi:hypothetical protein